MEKMIENGQMSVATSANEKVVKYVNNIHCKGTKATVKVESHKYASDTHSAHSIWVDYYYDIKQLKDCFHHNDYMDAEKFYVKEGRNWVEFYYDYEAVEKAIVEKAEKIENIVEKLKAKKAEMEKAEVITEAVPAEEKNYYFDCATNFYERGVVYNVLNADNLYNWFKKSKNKLTITIKEAKGFIGVIYKADDGWWIKMLNSLATGDLIEERYWIGKRITKKSFNDIVMWINAYVSDIWATPTEDNAETEKVDDETITEAEDNNVYFTYNDIYEALNTILNAKSSKVQIELHEISEITDIPKSMCFYRQSSGNIGINFINYCDAEDPLAECYDFAEDYLRENASDIAFELSYRPFNDDPHPQTEDYEEDAEYKKAEAEAVKALPF